MYDRCLIHTVYAEHTEMQQLDGVYLSLLQIPMLLAKHCLLQNIIMIIMPN